MIGIAITTHNRRDVLARILPSVRPTTPPDAYHVVAWDGPTVDDIQWMTEWRSQVYDFDVVYGDRAGVAANRNRAVRCMLEAGCEWLVLLEDDVMPLRRGWADLLVAAGDASGQACVSRVPTYGEWPLRIAQGVRRMAGVKLWRPEWLGGLDWPDSVKVVWNNWATATVQAIHRDAFERVGLYDEGFGLYGHEHTEWQMRLHTAGLVDKDGHPHIAADDVAAFLADIDCPPSYADEYGPEFQTMIERNGTRVGELAAEHKAKYSP